MPYYRASVILLFPDLRLSRSSDGAAFVWLLLFFLAPGSGR